MNELKNFVHRGFDVLGLEVRTKRALREAHQRELKGRASRPWQLLRNQNFDQVIDVGANIGQFAEMARALWPKARIDSFEPLPDVFLELTKRLGTSPNFFAHQVALGRERGKVAMKSNDFSPSSSILDLAKLHTEEWPNATGVKLVDVPVETLDEWYKASGQIETNLLIKIDVQGYELEVLEGALDVLRRARWIVLEVSFYELYKGQPLFGDIHKKLDRLGYVYRGSIEQFMNKAEDKLLFADALFENMSICSAV